MVYLISSRHFPTTWNQTLILYTPLTLSREWQLQTGKFSGCCPVLGFDVGDSLSGRCQTNGELISFDLLRPAQD
ncbi:hypothetical protein PC117_g8838 [Phytophthora cactorum]|uniref:Uncharacterized protein n=1 Tax=Phytophthora cactorum TaxID=29920 RepID=A0A8T1DYC9_9STRA|nr:hypothetical protein PC117_g8838 [Phytophthora cactorum]